MAMVGHVCLTLTCKRGIILVLKVVMLSPDYKLGIGIVGGWLEEMIKYKKHGLEKVYILINIELQCKVISLRTQKKNVYTH